MLAEQVQVGFGQVQAIAGLRREQLANLVVEGVPEIAQVRLAFLTLGGQLFPLARLRQAIAVGAEQLGRTTQVAAVLEDLLQGATGLAEARLVHRILAQVAILELGLRLQERPTIGRLLQQQQGSAGAQVSALELLTALLWGQRQPGLDVRLG